LGPWAVTRRGPGPGGPPPHDSDGGSLRPEEGQPTERRGPDGPGPVHRIASSRQARSGGRPRHAEPRRLRVAARRGQLILGTSGSFKSDSLRGSSLGKPSTSYHREESGLVYRMVCRGPPAGQYWWSYAEPKWEAAGNDSDVNPSRARATRDRQGRPW